MHVQGITGLYESANLACRRDRFTSVHGFPVERLVDGRPFGEDSMLGSALARDGKFRFAADAVVHHRVLPGSYRQLLGERRRLAGFPPLVRALPELAGQFPLGVFLSRHTVRVDVGLTGFAAVLGTRRVWPGLLAVPWLASCWKAAASRPGRPRSVRAVQLGIADLAGLVALVVGSVKARRPVL
jgi:hypothetical protein